MVRTHLDKEVKCSGIRVDLPWAQTTHFHIVCVASKLDKNLFSSNLGPTQNAKQMIRCAGNMTFIQRQTEGLDVNHMTKEDNFGGRREDVHAVLGPKKRNHWVCVFFEIAYTLSWSVFIGSVIYRPNSRETSSMVHPHACSTNNVIVVNLRIYVQDPYDHSAWRAAHRGLGWEPE